MKLRGLAPNFYIQVSGAIKFVDNRPPILQQVDRSSKYLNRPQIHECGNWEQGRAASFLGIHKSDLLCSMLSPIEDDEEDGNDVDAGPVHHGGEVHPPHPLPLPPLSTQIKLL